MPFVGADSIKVVSIDLDNTLWDVVPTLVAAERVLEDWLADRCPEVLAHYRPEVTTPIRDELMREQPGRAHDLGFLRRTVMEQVFELAGADTALVEPAFEVFFAARNEVTLFADVLPALERLASRYALVALTDGNADLELVGLGRYFDHYVNALQVGAAKPAPAMFAAVREITAVAAEEVVHIGDDPVKDVGGANNAGMRSVWVNRTTATWTHAEIVPDAEVVTLTQLADRLMESP